MKKRNMYEKPSMKVYELQQQPQLLAGSNGGGTDNYTPDNYPYSW